MLQKCYKCATAYMCYAWTFDAKLKVLKKCYKLPQLTCATLGPPRRKLKLSLCQRRKFVRVSISSPLKVFLFSIVLFKSCCSSARHITLLVRPFSETLRIKRFRPQETPMLLLAATAPAVSFQVQIKKSAAKHYHFYHLRFGVVLQITFYLHRCLCLCNFISS